MMRALVRFDAQRAARGTATVSGVWQVKKPVLHDVHKALGGMITLSGGYYMPVKYTDGVKDSHLHVRSSAGLFDISYQGQVKLRGKGAVALLERLVVADIKALAPGSAASSLLTSEHGFIIDNTVVTKLDGDGNLGMVINCDYREMILEHLRAHVTDARLKGEDVALEVVDDHERLALEGPRAAEVLGGICTEDLVLWPFMTARSVNILGTTMHVTRCGHTGEDGFEISVPANKTCELWETLTVHEAVRPAGWGARGSLGLEVGRCRLRGNIDLHTTVEEAGLSWTVPLSRRKTGGFLGSNITLRLTQKRHASHAWCS